MYLDLLDTDPPRNVINYQISKRVILINASDNRFMELSRGREHFLEIFKVQVDDIILPWVVDGVPMYWWVPIS